jgi:hypothetical protein|tara:strand:+ start:778 stop:954 length:177 start_codon:yes stop_codon:yes gene_type:complete
MDGNKKNTKTVNELNKPSTPIGEFTILEEPVVPVIPSQIPAVVAAIKKDINKNIVTYI